MRKLTEHIIAVAGRILFIGFTMQIIFGMIWMAGNFAHCQQFGEVNSLLYPAVLMIAKGMGRIFPVPYYCFVYIFQVGLCFYAAYLFVGIAQDTFFYSGNSGSDKHRGIGQFKKLFRIWSAMAVITAVPVMQCMLALLPYAMTGALMLMELGAAIKIISGRDQRLSEMARVLAFWMLQALLLHEYMLFGAVPVIVVLITGLFGGASEASLYAEIEKPSAKRFRKTAYNAAAAIAALVMLSAVYGACERTGLYEEKNPGLIKGLFSRTCLTTVLWDWDTWTDELVDQLAWEVRYSASYYADNITLEVEPYIDEKYGDGAKEFYLSTIDDAWTSYKTDIIHETLWDIAGYGISPVIIKRQLSGLGYMSLTARNYDMMKRSTPILTKYYVNFFLDWCMAAFTILIICAMATAVNRLFNAFSDVKQIRRCRKEKSKGIEKRKIVSLLLLFLTAACMCIRYVFMGAGIMDYKRTIMITMLWITLMLFPVFGTGKTLCNGGKDEGCKDRKTE